MRFTATFWFWLLLGSALVVLLSGCGLINGALGHSGMVPGANTPEAQQGAAAVDYSIWRYLGELFGVQPPTPQGPSPEAKTVTMLAVGATAKHIVRGTRHVARSVASGVGQTARALRGGNGSATATKPG